MPLDAGPSHNPEISRIRTTLRQSSHGGAGLLPPGSALPPALSARAIDLEDAGAPGSERGSDPDGADEKQSPGAPVSFASIGSIGEWIDVLRLLHDGHHIVRASDMSGYTTIAGGPLYYSFEALVQFGIIELISEATEPSNPLDPWSSPKPVRDQKALASLALLGHGVPRYRMSRRGRPLARRMLKMWNEMPWHRRLLLRAFR